MLQNNLSYHETMRRYFPDRNHKDFHFIKNWKRIYLNEGVAGLMAQRRGRKSTNESKKDTLNQESENALAAENKRLKEQLLYAQAEIEYLKKLDALVRAEEQHNDKKQ